jgi:hypothetical protein
VFPRQFAASVLIGICLLVLIIRLVQRGRLDIAYCWLWLGVGIGILLIVLRYNWLVALSRAIGAVTPTTTLFLIGFVVVLLMCLQFSLVVSAHRRQIKKLTQHIALLEDKAPPPSPDAGPAPGPAP